MPLKDKLLLEWELLRRAGAAASWLPVGHGLLPSDDLQIRARRYLALAQGIIGLAGAVVLWAAGQIWAQPVAAVLAVATIVLLSGARNWQGFAATLDGLSPAPGDSGMLHRLQTDRLGVSGVMGVALGLALIVAILATVPLRQGSALLVAGLMLGGMAQVHIKATTLPVRREGMQAKLFEITDDGYRVALATTTLALALCLPVLDTGGAVSACAGAILGGQIMRWLSVREMGGYTRETLGAVQVMAMLGAMAGAAI
ncbi:adenosylcobinamide-GDP ribazoletransferase [Sagittula sp. SSi028]|uniref:adenosylcobinamide-GDP ribazoletransferase n=1 Tax=Sagittula sp. SSi028 TaxID=3400636 RepID=UPI003AF88DEB